MATILTQILRCFWADIVTFAVRFPIPSSHLYVLLGSTLFSPLSCTIYPLHQEQARIFSIIYPKRDTDCSWWERLCLCSLLRFERGLVAAVSWQEIHWCVWSGSREPNLLPLPLKLESPSWEWILLYVYVMCASIQQPQKLAWISY